MNYSFKAIQVYCTIELQCTNIAKLGRLGLFSVLRATAHKKRSHRIMHVCNVCE